MKKNFVHIVLLVVSFALSVNVWGQYCLDATDGRYAKFVSDRGIGISLYEKGRFLDAVPYLESAHELCPTDSVLCEYLYFSYKNTLRNMDANSIFSSVPVASVAAYGLKSHRPVSSIYAEGGALFADNKTYWDDSYIYFERYVVGNGGFASVDLSNEIGAFCELSHHIGVTTRTNPVEMKSSNNTYFNLRSKYVGFEYEVNAQINLSSRWKVTPFARVGVETYDLISFSLDTVVKSAKEASDWGSLNEWDWNKPAPEGWSDPNTPSWNNQPWGGYPMWPGMYYPYPFNPNWGNVDYPTYGPDFWTHLNQISYSYSHKSERQSRWDIMVGCSLAYTYGKHVANADFSYFHGENLHVWQAGLSYKIHPMGNVNLYLLPRISYICRRGGPQYEKLPGSFLAEIVCGGKIYKNLWGSASFLYGNVCDYHDRDSHIFYSLSCETKLRSSAQLIYLLNNHLSLILTYKYVRKKSNFFSVDKDGYSELKPYGQNDNVIAGGVQWNF